MFSKKNILNSVITSCLVFFIALNTHSEVKVSAATETARVSYVVNSGVGVVNSNLTKFTGSYLKSNSNWKIFGNVSRLNVLYYKVGKQQFVPARYLDKISENSEQKLSGIGQVISTRAKNAFAWTDPRVESRIIPSFSYRNGQKVSITTRVIMNGRVWYGLANGHWLDGQNVKLVSEKSRSEKNYSIIKDASDRSLSQVSKFKSSVKPATVSTSTVSNLIFGLMNKYRIQNGRRALVLHNGLNVGANIRANEEIAAIRQTGNNNSVDHLRPNGTKFSTEPNVRSFGAGGYGENLAVLNGQANQNALAQHFFNSWINSPGHRANILNGRFTSTGISVIKLSNGQFIGMQEFAGR